MSHSSASRILLGLAIGATAGAIAHAVLGDSPGLVRFVTLVSEPIGKIFLRLLFMLVIPIVATGLALGVTGLGDLRSVARIGVKTLLYTIAVSCLAVLIGITLVGIFR